MSVVPSRFIFLIGFLLFAFHGFSQDEIPLEEFLKNVERNTSLRFTYKDEDLVNHVIKPLSFSDPNEVLAYLESNSLFDFEPLNDDIIAMRLQKGLISICGEIQWNMGELPQNILVKSSYQMVPTGTNGIFMLLSPNNNGIVTISGNEIQSRLLEIQNFPENDCLTINLEPKIEKLSPVTLTEFLAKGISKDKYGALGVNYETFEILPGLIEPDVLLTLKSLPGVQSANETISYLNIRGGTNDQNLIRWDGIKMYQNSHFFGLISAFNPYVTQKVSLIKNGTPADLGDGVSGVIDMKTASEINQQIHGGAGVNLLSTDAFVDTPLGNKASLQVAARKSINNLFDTPTFESYSERAFQNTELTASDDIMREDSNFSFFDTSLRLLYHPTEKDHIRLNFIILANSLDFNENAEINNRVTQRTSQLVQNSFSSSLWYQRDWSDQFQTELQFYGTNYKLEALNADILNNQSLFQKNDVLENNFKATAFYTPWKGVQFSGGYQFNETGINNFEFINNPFFELTDKQVLRTHSFYGASDISFWENTTLNAGLRANYIDKFDTFILEPRLAFHQRFAKYFVFEILGEMKSQTTSQIVDLQEDFLGIENRRWVLSNNQSLPIITSRQISSGISLNRKGWLLSGEAYLKEVKGITTQGQGFQNQLEDLREHGSYLTYGLEMLVSKRFKNINTWLSYTYAINDYTFESFTPQEFPNNVDIRHSLTYGINYKLNHFTLSGGFNWHSGIPTTLLDMPTVVDSSLNFLPPNNANIQDYFRVDFSGTYTFPISKGLDGFVGLSIWNLFDTQNVVNHFYQLTDEGPIEVDDEALGITPNFSFRINF